ncbi:MAG: UPF0182 family protein [Eubacteriales bacterium]
MKNKRFGIGTIIVVLLVLISGFGTLVNFITDYLWFKELGYTSVFWKQLTTQLTLGIPTFVVIMILTFFYLKVLKIDYYKKIEFTGTQRMTEKNINLISLAIGILFAFFTTMATTTQLWFEILKYMNSTSFNITDPIFKMDISFYVFKYSLLTQLNQIVIGVVLAYIALTCLYYMFLMSIRTPKMFEPKPYDDSDQYGNAGAAFMGPLGRGISFNKDNIKEILALASRQIMILGALFFLMMASNLFLKQFSILYDHSGIVYGAGFTDVNITLWVYRILIGLSLISAVTFVLGIMRKKYKLAATVPVLMILVSILGTGISLGVQNFVVSPDEINKQSQYLQNNITFTQNAYNLNNIEIKDFPVTNNLTKQDILNNTSTIENIRINDYEPAKQFYNQTQSIRLYYLFNDVDVDRYVINGKYTQVFLSAREIDETKIQQQWLTKNIKYTHGYGITLSRVDKVTTSGQPDMLIQGIPPVSEVPEIKITRPEIYFGELTNNYIITNTAEKEFDYPSGESNVYSTYQGDAGIKMTLMNRILFAFKEKSAQILVSTNINSDSKIVIYRNIKERLQKLAPFVYYDEDPYVVTVDGKLYWIVDGYTTSDYYPYSQPFSATDPTNYIRNSVKVVIDAYNGKVNYYMVDNKDPVVNNLAKIYPVLFKDFSEMPAGLKAHIRYPNMMFSIQAEIYKRYHMNDVKVFYQGEDLWDISYEIYGRDRVQMKPSYYIMKLPGEKDVEFINSIPYTPKDKPNMSGLLVARNDGEHYGKLVLYRLPKEKLIYGPMQIDSQIDQDTTISKEFSLWGSTGSTYIRGNTFVIPIESSFIYIEPIYLQADNVNSLPEVKRVIVAYNDRIAYEPTLQQALDSLFGTGGAIGGTGNTGGGVISGGTPDVKQLITLANEAFKNATAAQQNGDWTAYGKYLAELKRYLTLLSPDQNPTTPSTDTTTTGN